MKNYGKFIFLIAGLTSCSPKFYTPNTQNVPLISEKGEVDLTLAGNVNQVEFLGAYGIGNHVAIIANGAVFIPSNLDNGNGGSGKSIELGAGYFLPIKEKWVFETYGIFGIGSVENHLPSTKVDYPLTDGKISANIFRAGIQPNFGFKSKYFSAAISSRIIYLSYNKIRGGLIFEDELQSDYLRKNSSNFLVEPALTLRGGFEKFKLQVQCGYSVNMSNINFRQDKFFLTLGLNFNFN